MLTIHYETFTPDAQQSPFCVDFGHVDGLVEVSLEGRRRSVEARKNANGYWIIRGLVASYPRCTRAVSVAVYVLPAVGVIYIRPNQAGSGGRWPALRLTGFVEDWHDGQALTRKGP
jgi:hypothetical protein